MQTLPTREEVPTELTWDLSKIFATDADWQAAYDDVLAQGQAAGQLQGTLGTSAEALAAGITQILGIYRALEKVYVYASMKSDQDTGNATYQAMNAKAESMAAVVSSQTAFLEPEVLAIAPATLADWVATNDTLRGYKHYLDGITVNRDHVLTADAESLLSAAGDALGASRATFNVLDNSDIDLGTVTNEAGETVALSNGLYGQLMRSTKRPVREGAFKTLFGAYAKLQNTFAQTLSGETKRHNFLATAHHYDSAREAAMANNHIPTSVFDTLIKEVNAHLPLLHRYVALRKQLLGVDELHMYDMYVPLTGKPPLSYTYQEAQAEAKRALAPLGEDYLSHLDHIYASRDVDVMENKGKRSGAYSGGAYDTDPYILLNWQDSVDELYTLVHESGHSVHSWYTRHNQPYVYGDYPIFVAEIASTSNENLLTDYFLKTQTDPKVRAYILNYYLDGFKGTVFRQAEFAEFEHWIHLQDAAGEPLTAKSMSAYYADLNARYYGPAVARDPEIALEWARIPHFYMNYYVYQYATGFAAASTLASRITAGVPGAVDQYLGYLKSGSSKDAIDTMKLAGVDMTKPDYLEAAFKVFETRLDELEGLINQ
ncbi:oligoendopeptidase F [Lacticaseibacillus nasuensis]|uniref:Oligopeptidase F n=1 Tax=Lacticaseibacillus nasuensis JCM 17158 TaxID=1291734 RepID=A0A0R1K1N5_9LACO|nr:oligoendopeptidase F [Lacticaseibacillus nasuensis]KRK74058.1 oligoendopeptidase F [Lacticaseibacillus nasuensis JCM 17158]